MDIDIYTLDDLYYNSRGLLQVSPTEAFEDIEKTLAALGNELRTSSQLEKSMLAFFLREVEPSGAYRDNDVGQGEGGPRRLFAVGRLKRVNDKGLFVRLGIRALGENPLIPALQALYLQAEEQIHPQYFKGQMIGQVHHPDCWVYDFTDRYQGMVKEVNLRTRKGITSLVVIAAINEAILNGACLAIEPPTHMLSD